MEKKKTNYIQLQLERAKLEGVYIGGERDKFLLEKKSLDTY